MYNLFRIKLQFLHVKIQSFSSLVFNSTYDLSHLHFLNIHINPNFVTSMNFLYVLFQENRFFSPDSMTSLPWDDRKSKSVARMKRAKGIWRFRRTVHGISYINAERCEENTGFFFNGS
ncbi:hypothetical protein HanPI659440_Chr15g0602251 [Helianthus annuus]|nr:hypothetical protein HanPI659440_Chr15g0602251 [Helianthus annuus]